MRQFIALSLFDIPLPVLSEKALQTLGSRYEAVPSQLFPLPAQANTTHEPSATLWAPAKAPERSAFMGHQEDGWYTLTHALAAALKVDTLQLRATSMGSDRFVCEFRYWTGGEATRLVQVINNHPWTFFQRGEPLPVEDVDRYRRRRIRDRLTPEYLANVASALGWPVAAPQFWESMRTPILLSGKSVA